MVAVSQELTFVITAEATVRLTLTCLKFRCVFLLVRRSCGETITFSAKYSWWTLRGDKTRTVCVLHKKFDSIEKSWNEINWIELSFCFSKKNGKMLYLEQQIFIKKRNFPPYFTESRWKVPKQCSSLGEIQKSEIPLPYIRKIRNSAHVIGKNKQFPIIY